MQYKREKGEPHPEYERAELHLQLMILGGELDESVPISDITEHAQEVGIDSGAIYDVMAEYVRSNVRILHIPHPSRYVKLTDAAKEITKAILEPPKEG